MDANWSFKPAATAVNFDHARLPGSNSAVVAPTVLPAENTVRPTSEAQSARNDAASSERPFKSELILDPQSNQVIYRVRDAESRQVLWQVPDAATLRLRAYARTVGSNADQPPALSRLTDVEA